MRYKMKASTALSLQMIFTMQCFRLIFITNKIHGLFYQCYTCPCPCLAGPRQSAYLSKWQLQERHCKICTLLKCRLNSLHILTQISCVISYRDCILASVCMTLHVLNRTKAHHCCQSCFKLSIYLLPCGCHFLSGVQKSIPLPRTISQYIALWLAWFLERQAQIWMLFLAVIEKRDVSGACSDKKVDSCVNYQLPFICLVHGDTHR